MLAYVGRIHNLKDLKAPGNGGATDSHLELPSELPFIRGEKRCHFFGGVDIVPPSNRISPLHINQQDVARSHF